MERFFILRIGLKKMWRLRIVCEDIPCAIFPRTKFPTSRFVVRRLYTAQKGEHVAGWTGRLKVENRDNSRRRMNSLLRRLRFSQSLSKGPPQSGERTTNNYRLKLSRNKVSTDNILRAMSLCFSTVGFIEYHRVDVSLFLSASKEPQYVFQLLRSVRITPIVFICLSLFFFFLYSYFQLSCHLMA